MELQKRISAERQQRFVGRTETVLVEGVSRETDLLLEGRTRYQAPEIDGVILLDRGRPGEWLEAEIVGAFGTDLEAEVVR